MKKSKTQMENQLRFTLIELLVVIAIIAILASMLLPALNKVKQTGEVANCKGTQKNIGTYIMLYVDTYNDYIPALFDQRRNNGQYIWLFLENLKMGLKRDVYKFTGCKAHRPKIANKIATEGKDAYNADLHSALFSYNCYLGYHLKNGSVGTTYSQCYPIGKMSAVKKPTTKILAADTASGLFLSYIRYYVNYKDDNIAWPHDGAANVVYLDGHAQTHKHTDFQRYGNLDTNPVTDGFLKPDK